MRSSDDIVGFEGVPDGPCTPWDILWPESAFLYGYFGA